MSAPLAKVLACLPDFVQGPDQGIDRVSEAGERRILADPALLDLFGENLRVALRDGGLVAQYRLGEAIARYLIERDRHGA